MRAGCLIVVAAVLCALTSSAQAQDDPFVGFWKMNALKSTFDPGPPYKTATLNIERVEGGHKATTERVEASGRVVHQEVIEKLDGLEHPVEGAPAPTTRAYRSIDDHTFEYVQRRSGRIISTVRVAVSADGKTITVRATGSDPQGREDVIVYEK